MTHTPTPWTTYVNDLGTYPITAKQGPIDVQPAKAFSAADAAFIVKAVNNHDALVEALKNVQSLISEAALTGFNCKDGDWAERLFASQQMTSKTLFAVARGL